MTAMQRATLRCERKRLRRAIALIDTMIHTLQHGRSSASALARNLELANARAQR
jgi:hypothetical protein